MYGLLVLLISGVFAGLLPGRADAQSVAETCLEQGFRPGSAAYRACIGESENMVPGMFDPVAAQKKAEEPPVDQDKGASPAPETSPISTWGHQSAPSSSGKSIDQGASMIWNWPKPEQ